MKMITDLFSGEILIETDMVSSVIIENPSVLMRLLQNIYSSVNGQEEGIVLSKNHAILKPSKVIELVSTYVPFNVNEKRVQNKLISILEKEALNEENYYRTMELLAQIERFVNSLSEGISCRIECTSCNPLSLIKMCGIAVSDDSISDIERVFEYMMIVREVLGEKLFVFVNMHSFFSLDEIQNFVNTVIAHNFYVLLLDSHEYGIINHTRRLIVDQDLCVI